MRVLKEVDLDPHDRQKRLPGWQQERIAGAKCLVVGAGALGNEVIKNLLQLGVQKITVVDFDEVVPANLNRCVFFTPEDAAEGRKKAEVIAQRAREHYPQAQVTAVLKRVEQLPEVFYGSFEYGFGCLDNLGARLHVNAQLYAANTPFIDGGTTGYLGKVQVVRSPGPCLECSMSQSDYALLWRRYSCTGEGLDMADPKMPALPTTTSIVAGLQAKEFVKMAHGQPSLQGHLAYYNGLDGKLNTYQVDKRVGCPIH